MLLRTVEANPDRWILLKSYPPPDHHSASRRNIRVYRLTGHAGKRVRDIRVYFGSNLDWFIEK